MKKIKAIIFDLDNTLYDAEILTEDTLKQAVAAMIEKGLDTSIEEGFKKIKEIIKKNPSQDKFRELAKAYGQEDESIIRAGHQKYTNPDFDKVHIFPDTKKVLIQLKKYKIVLLSQGNEQAQQKKIDLLGIRHFFDTLLFPQMGQKEAFFKKALKDLQLKPEEILVVGDRIDNELKIAKSLGMKTVRLLHGKYAPLKPKNADEIPDVEIKKLSELIPLLKS